MEEVAKEIKPPFEVEILDAEPVEVFNRFGGNSIVLSPLEVAVYDYIIGAEMLGNFKMVRKGIDWFIKNNIDAYSVLLV